MGIRPGGLGILMMQSLVDELLYNEDRYCLWLADIEPTQLRALPPILRRVEAVRQWRARRGRETTRELATTPQLFAEVRQPASSYLAVPTLSSEKRRYIPIGFLPATTIASNQLYILPNATPYHFGVLHSAMHMAWVRHVGGRLELRYRYSTAITYNNFPWPQSVPDRARARIEAAARPSIQRE